MCEIFFLHAGSAETVPDNDLLDLFLTAADEASDMNGDGFGAFNDDRKVVKSADSFTCRDAVKLYREYRSSRFVVLHLRMATCGEVCMENSHPFQAGDNVLVHNGTVRTPEQYGKGRADSYQLLHDVYDRKDGDTVEAVKESLGESSGSVSVFLLDYRDRLYYFRETSSFAFKWNEDTGTVAGATKRHRLHDLWSDAETLEGRPNEETIYRVSSTGEIQEVSEFDMGTNHSYHRSGYRRHGHRRRNWSDNTSYPEEPDTGSHYDELVFREEPEHSHELDDHREEFGEFTERHGY